MTVVSNTEPQMDTNGNLSSHTLESCKNNTWKLHGGGESNAENTCRPLEEKCANEHTKKQGLQNLTVAYNKTIPHH